jgi:hypothetical protein
MFDSYINRAFGTESSFNPFARNPLSSATGLGQFTDGTWQGLMNSYPELALTADGRTDPTQARRAMEQFTFDNAAILKKNGYEPTDNNLYAMHRFGASGGPKLLGSDPNAPIESVVSPDIIKANPDLPGKTVGQVLNRWTDSNPSGLTDVSAQRRQPGSFAPPATAFQGKRQDAPAPDAADDSFMGKTRSFLNQYDVPNTMINVGASLASISDPKQAAALASMAKPTDEFGIHISDKTGAVYRINKKTGQVQMVTGPQDNKLNDAYDTSLGKELVDQRKKYQQDAVNAVSNNKDLDALSGALANPNVPQGPWGSTRVTLMKAANMLGIDNAKDLADADVANAVGQKLALKLRNPADGAGMPGNFSDQDRNFLMAMTPGVNMTPEANKRLIELSRAANDRAIALDAMRRDYEREHGRLDTGFEQKVADWDKKNTFMSSYARQEAQGGPAMTSSAATAPGGRPPLSSIFK